MLHGDVNMPSGRDEEGEEEHDHVFILGKVDDDDICVDDEDDKM